MADIPVNANDALTVVAVTSAGQVSFDYDFRADNISDLKANFKRANGSVIPLVGGVDFTASGIGTPNGGTITITTITDTATGETVSIYRDTIIARPTDYTRDVFAQDINAEQDKIFMILQEQSRDVKRASKSVLGAVGYEYSPDIQDGDTIMKQGNALVRGPNLPDLAASMIALAAAQADRSRDEADRAWAEANRSGSEANRAAGYVNDIVSEKEVPITGTRNGMQFLSFPAGLNSIETRGYAIMGVGAAPYVRVAAEPAHGLKVRSQDRFLPNGSVDAVNGGWWEIAVLVLFAEMAGVMADGAIDDRAAIDRAFRYIEARGGGTVVFPPREMRMSGGVGWCNGLAIYGVPGKTKFKLDRGINTEMFTNLRQVDDIPIDDLTIDGIIFDANAAGTENFAASAVTVNGYRRLRVRNSIFENATGYGLGLQAKPTGSTISGPQDECWLEDSVFRNNGHNTASDQHDGLDMKSANKIWAKNLTAHDNGDKGLDFRGLHVVAEDCVSYDNATFGISIQAGPLASGGTAAYCSFRGLETYRNGARGVQIAFDAVLSGEDESVIVLDDIKSYENTLDGVIITDPFATGKFRITASNVQCWDNGNHGFNDFAAGGTVVLVNGRFEGNAQTGAVTAGVGRSFIGCHFLRNGTVGFDEVLSAANNKLIACHFDGNTSGTTSLNGTGDTELIGCTGIPNATIFGRPATNWVNRWRMEGRGSGAGPRLSAEGSDPNIPAVISGKGNLAAQFYTGTFGTEVARLDDPSSGNTAMLLSVHDGALKSLRRVSVGAADSGGSGFRILRVPN